MADPNTQPPEYVLVDPSIHKPQALTNDGRCCGHKPLRYKRVGGPHFFCTSCKRAYALDNARQIQNWAWRRLDGGFQSTQKRKKEARETEYWNGALGAPGRVA